MRDRALIHVAGPARAGKTTFIERLLGADHGLAICVRGKRDPTVHKARESTAKANPELRRYRAAGAAEAVLYRFATPEWDAFYDADVMQEYSKAVYIEGDCPIHHVDLSVFVAAPPAEGRSLLCRVVRDPAEHRSPLDHLTQELGGADALTHLFGTALGGQVAGRLLRQPATMELIRRMLESERERTLAARAAGPTERWALEAGYEGLERAQLVIVNVRSDKERSAADVLLSEIPRLRKDAEVFRDLIGLSGDRRQITAVAADLSNPKDPGLRKALARVRRASV